jgi:hypothetical protein
MRWRENVVPQVARFQVLVRPEWCAGGRIDGVWIAPYLVALAPAVLVHHRENTMNLVGVPGVEYQVRAGICGSVVEVRDRVCCV